MTDQLDWTGHNPRTWRTCAEHGRYDAQDGGCPDCAEREDREDDDRGGGRGEGDDG